MQGSDLLSGFIGAAIGAGISALFLTLAERRRERHATFVHISGWYSSTQDALFRLLTIVTQEGSGASAHPHYSALIDRYGRLLDSGAEIAMVQATFVNAAPAGSFLDLRGKLYIAFSLLQDDPTYAQMVTNDPNYSLPQSLSRRVAQLNDLIDSLDGIHLEMTHGFRDSLSYTTIIKEWVELFGVWGKQLPNP